jgi:hypothetical protein
MNMQTRLAAVYADVESGSSARAGTYVAGRIVLSKKPALVVPASAIVVRDGYSFVFEIVDEGNQRLVKQQRVEIGRRTDKGIEILAGLNEGKRVVTKGAGFLDDGDRVRVVAGVPQ